ncbi:DUF3499 family protein [Cryobacterium sp. PH31-O1]|uniref:DUF3499 family protein n=1 Tax=Cryobacterium sp. PH31-O1 TaxID=3046306 RepID=UPI0024BBC6F8|nr:DUF3499 family protein [Cryobacterium sp. PH31-O1]MDJ0337533.1 DUF3499 family protein [Cryobacterium sp. PH31-O1]
MTFRPCSRVACLEPSVATLTFDYGESLAVLGPLSGRKEPHSFDLCSRHAERTSAPQGWQLMRHRLIADDPGAAN